MKTVATYLFESTFDSSEKAIERAASVSKTIREWLVSKNVSDPSEGEGVFVSKTPGQQGRFVRKVVAAGNGQIEEVTLEEPTISGQIFVTHILVAHSNAGVAVHSTLSVQTVNPVLAPASTPTNCPLVVRKIISMFSDWKVGGYLIGQTESRQAFGSASGHELEALISLPSRTLPLVVVSQIEGEPIWSDLTRKLAHDLTGIAQVYEIDYDAAWALTERVGKGRSCYLGAVRIYWPLVTATSEDNFPRSRVWTASALLSDDRDGRGLDRFCGFIKSSLMSLAVLALDVPRFVREIHNLAARSRLDELEAKATAHSEELEIAKLYLSDNEQLKEELDAARSQAAALQARAEAAEYALQQLKSDNGCQDNEEIQEDAVGAPTPGENRFYKKTHSTPTYDVLVPVKDCGHTKWQNASKADKAKKGVEKFEGRNDWKNIHHCGSCTGGGMWRVQW